MARQLAAAEARVDIRAEMGWDADDAEVNSFQLLSLALCLCPVVGIRLPCGHLLHLPPPHLTNILNLSMLR